MRRHALRGRRTRPPGARRALPTPLLLLPLVVALPLLAGVRSPTSAVAATRSPATPLTFTPLVLKNGWHSENSVFGTGNPGVARSSDGIVYLHGSLAGGPEGVVAFILPTADDPAHDVYVPIYTYDGTSGALEIYSDGYAYLHSTDNKQNSPLYSSLAGISFPSAGASAPHTPLTLVNGWKSAPASYDAGAPVVSKGADGIVRLSGALSGGTDAVAFTLPSGDRPSHVLNMPIYTYLPDTYSEVGSIYVTPSGKVQVYGPAATQFASLDGIEFPAPTASLKFSSLSLLDGWKVDPVYSTGPVAVAKSSDGVVYLEGSVVGGTSSEAFVLPSADRPVHDLYLPIFTEDGSVGSALVEPDGGVYLYGGNATSQASVAGISFPIKS